jgi:hypothetical protein
LEPVSGAGSAPEKYDDGVLWKRIAASAGQNIREPLVPVALLYGGIAMPLTWPGITAEQAWGICVLLLASHFLLKIPAIREKLRFVIGLGVASLALAAFPALLQLHAGARDAVVAAYESVQESRAAAREEWLTRTAPLRTRPLYDESSDERYMVLECEREAIETGNLNSPYSNRSWATSFFRRCLAEKGLAWEQCTVGESGCGLLDRMFSRGRSPIRSRFVPGGTIRIDPYRR